MTLASIQGKCPVCHQDSANTAFQAGAASRDAEVAELKSVPMKYRRMAFNAQLQDEVTKLEKENNQLRAHINALRNALAAMLERFKIHSDSCIKQASTAIASTTEQSLAAYRNKVIEECAAKCKDKHVNGNWMYDYREECEAAILDMKEQP